MHIDESETIHIAEGAALFIDGCEFAQRRQV